MLHVQMGTLVYLHEIDFPLVTVINLQEVRFVFSVRCNGCQQLQIVGHKALLSLVFVN